MEKISIKDLLQAGVHLGHPTRRWNPKMKPYIHGARNGIYIFDLIQTMKSLDSACRYLYDAVLNGGSVLFVGTKRQAQEVIRDAASRTGMYYMCERWLGGTLTNHRTIRKSIAKMESIQALEDSGDLAKRPKKEASSMRRVHGKLHRNLAGIATMTKMPDVMVVVDVEREDIAIREARSLGIPVVALVDTNCDPDCVNHVIPGNDDALRSIKLVVEALAGSIDAARQAHLRQMEDEAREREEARKAADAEAAARKAARAEAEAKAKAEKADAQAKAAAAKSETNAEADGGPKAEADAAEPEAAVAAAAE